jgi:thioredoxin reductase (NADPH)
VIAADEILEIEVFRAMEHRIRARIASRSADIRVNAGEWVANEGDAPYFWVVLSGEIELVTRVGSETQQLTTFERGEYFGELSLMIGAGSISNARALTPARIMRIDPADFHFMLAASPEASDVLSSALMRRVFFRRDFYVNANSTEAAVVGCRYDPECHTLRDFMSRNLISYEWLDPDGPDDAASIPPAVRDADRYPVIILANGKCLETPSLRELAEGLKLQTAPLRDSYDVAIIGGGPSGLAAAVYGASEGLRTILIERNAPGGQAGTSSRIENYLGFPTGISGDDLASRALLQAKRFGAEIVVTRGVDAIVPVGDRHEIDLGGGCRIDAGAVVVATGVNWRHLETTGACRLTGRGVYYGAARTEALGARGKDVFLVGGGNSAGQAAMFFSSYARSVTLLVRGGSLEGTMSRYLIAQLETKDNIRIEADTTVIHVDGAEHIETISTRVGEDGAVQTRPAHALFVFIGADAETSWLPREVERDARGFLSTGRDIVKQPGGRAPFPLETSVPGIFAAGDVRCDSVKRVASSVGEGSMVIAYVHQYLALPVRSRPAILEGRMNVGV